jgi:uncharacterized protein
MGISASDNQRTFYTIVRLSENIYFDNDGMLICENAVLGKAGEQEYRGFELGLDDSEVYVLHRPEDEVFNPQSLASLRGKTLTKGHPTEDVNLENFARLSKGMVLDVRRIENTIVGDIKITDKEAINLVSTKRMRELSLGYTTKLVRKDDYSFIQTDIAYNHVALVPKGRAEVAKIVDNFTRILDKSMEEDLMDTKDKTILGKLLSAIGLKKVNVEGVDLYQMTLADEETQTEETPTQEQPVETVVEEVVETTIEDSNTNEDTLEETIENEDTTVNDTTDTTVQDETTVETIVEEVQENTTKVEDGGENTMDFESKLAKIKQIEEIKDESTRRMLLDEYLGIKTQPKEKDALSVFGEIQLGDGQDVDVSKEVEKELVALYDALNPSNYDTSEAYIKARKKIDKESGNFSGFLNEVFGGEA